MSCVPALLACSSGLEAGFYSALKVRFRNPPRVVRRIQETAITHYQAIQNLFSGINFATAVYYAAQLEKVCVLAVSPHLYVFIAFAMFLGIVSEYTSLLGKRNIFKAEELNGRSFSLEASTLPKDLSVGIQIGRLAANFFLFCYSAKRFWLGASLVTAFYNLLRCSSIQSVRFSRNFNLNPISHGNLVITRIEVVYRMVMLEADRSADEECAICYEPQEKRVASCQSHTLHAGCMLGWIDKGLESVLQGTLLKVDERGAYSIEIKRGRLPTCPCCRQEFSNSSLRAKVFSGNRKISSQASIV